ncbi:MAG: LPS export ABC transporter periplasmic protein LptC [Magnetospirillum sp. WYHS-4]
MSGDPSPSLRSGPARLLPTRIAGYSRFVATAKRLLPVGAAVLIGLVALWPHINKKDNRFRIGISVLQEGDSSAPNMLNPRYVGTDKENRPFSITADLARNISPGATTVDLEMPKADVTMNDGTWLVLTAAEGRYDHIARSLLLAGNVNLFHDTGYEIRTSKVIVDLSEGTAKGPDAVEGQGPFGDMKAEGFQIYDRGTTILLTGRAKVIMYPGAREDLK